MIRIFASLLILTSFVSAQAQDTAASDAPATTSSGLSLTHSVFGGLNVTKFELGGNFNNDDVEASGGAEVGYSMLLPLGDTFAIRTGAGAVQKSTVIEEDILLTGDVDIRLTYIEVPVTLYMPFANGVVAGIAGVNLDLLIADDCDTDFGACPVDSDDYKDFVANGVIGARFRLGRATSHHNLEALIEFGITDIDKNDSKIDSSQIVRYVYNF